MAWISIIADRIGRRPQEWTLFVTLLWMALPLSAAEQPADIIMMHAGDDQVQLEGAILAEEPERLVLLAPDGKMHLILREEIVSRTRSEAPFRPLSKEELAAKLLPSLPGGFTSHATKHYVFLVPAEVTDAKPLTKLLESTAESFYDEFFTFWNRGEFDLHEPLVPLPVVLFTSLEEFRVFAGQELGKHAQLVGGYYNPDSNLGVVTAAGGEKFKPSKLSSQQASWVKQVVTHECTHQLMANSGFRARHRHWPRWVEEGIAEWFEKMAIDESRDSARRGSPRRKDLGWIRFEKPVSLEVLLHGAWVTEQSESYAKSWALNSYLWRERRDEYLAFLRDLKSAEIRTRRENVAKFEQHFGKVSKLEADFFSDAIGRLSN